MFLIWNKPLIEESLPDFWKMCTVNLILKSGIPIDVSNYRPISILSNVSKLFDALGLRSIQPLVNRIFIDEQHVLQNLRLTTTCKLVFTNYEMNAVSMYSQSECNVHRFYESFWSNWFYYIMSYVSMDLVSLCWHDSLLIRPI